MAPVAGSAPPESVPIQPLILVVAGQLLLGAAAFTGIARPLIRYRRLAE
ncbi:hypothetical protein ABZ871_21840 [Streptomyces populi]